MTLGDGPTGGLNSGDEYTDPMTDPLSNPVTNPIYNPVNPSTPQEDIPPAPDTNPDPTIITDPDPSGLIVDPITDPTQSDPDDPMRLPPAPL